MISIMLSDSFDVAKSWSNQVLIFGHHAAGYLQRTPSDLSLLFLANAIPMLKFDFVQKISKDRVWYYASHFIRFSINQNSDVRLLPQDFPLPAIDG